MANDITNVMPKILAQGLMALRQQAVFPRLVNTSYSSEAAQRGNVINIPIPSAITARSVTPAVTFATNVDSSPTTTPVTLDRWMEAPFQLSDNDITSSDPMIIPMQASEAIKSLANDIDSFIWGNHVGFYGYAGTPGTTPFASGVTMANTARTILNRQLAPPDSRRAVLDPAAEGALLGTTNVLQFDQRGDPNGIINGEVGRKLGFDWFMDQNVSTFTPGTGWVTGWAASTVSGSAGDTTLNIINATASGTVKVGDLFTVAGSTQQYVITVAANATATTALAITFTPALASAVATGGALTVIATAYTANLAFHPMALAWASRPLDSLTQGGSIFQLPTDPVSGVALRLELSRQYKQGTLSYDYLGGSRFVRRGFGVKIFG